MSSSFCSGGQISSQPHDLARALTTALYKKRGFVLCLHKKMWLGLASGILYLHMV